MGTWGPKTFEDDIACDWLEDLEDSDPIAFFEHCLDLSGIEELDYLACIGVVCTAEMIYAMVGSPRDGLPEAAYSWLSKHGPSLNSVPRLIPTAIQGLRRVLESTSEMYERWEDADARLGEWIDQIYELQIRLELQRI